MRKKYVLDTSALIYDPAAWNHFPDSDVIIPIACITELDKLKKQSGEVGRNARVCIRSLDEISDKLDISTGVELENNILLKIDATYRDMSLPQYFGLGDPDYGDTQILACTLDAWKECPEHDVTLVSNDINLRVKAKSRSIDAVSHDSKSESLNELYMGHQSVINELATADLLKNSHIDPRAYNLQLYLNECITFESSDGDAIAFGRKVAYNKLKLIKKVYPWGLSSRNKEQSFLIDLIMDKDIDLITAVGKAGSGKSIVALATALELVLSKKEYEKLVIYRPIESVGKDLGFLPGLLEEKLAPHFSAIMDNFEILFGNKLGNDWLKDLEMFQRKGKIELGAISFIRGRSIPNSIMLIDECQNLSAEEVKTILTRAGDNTKIILTGDIDQIDNKFLDATNNGLVNVINKFIGSELYGHITLTEGERSRLATLAADIL